MLYDWLLCLGQEVEYIWQWRSGVTLSSLVYVFSRYTFIIQDFQSMMTIFPMSDLVCKPVIALPSEKLIIACVEVAGGLRLN